MTRDIVAVGPDAPIDEIARAMLEHHVHRVLVCEDRPLLGVITAFDLLRVLSRSSELAPHAALTRHTGYTL